MTTPQDVLMEAARVLMRDGWVQGNWMADDGRKCAMGAISAAANELCVDEYAVAEADAHLYRYVRAELGVRDSVEDWNDAPERTAEDVILALKRAANESA